MGVGWGGASWEAMKSPSALVGWKSSFRWNLTTRNTKLTNLAITVLFLARVAERGVGWGWGGGIDAGAAISSRPNVNLNKSCAVLSNTFPPGAMSCSRPGKENGKTFRAYLNPGLL